MANSSTLVNNSQDNSTVYYYDYTMDKPPPKTLAISALLAFLGSIGNIVVLLVYSKKERKSSTDSLIIVLAANDLVACLTVIPMDIFIWMDPDMNNIPCALYFFLFHCTYFTTLFILISIALERYLLICYLYEINTQLIKIKNAIILLLCVSVALSGMSVCFCIETEEAHNHDDVIYPEGEGEEGAAERVAGGGGARLTWWEEVIGWVAIVPDYATFVLLPTAVIALSIMYTMIFRRIVKQDEFRAQLQENTATVCTPIRQQSTSVFNQETKLGDEATCSSHPLPQPTSSSPFASGVKRGSSLCSSKTNKRHSGVKKDSLKVIKGRKSLPDYPKKAPSKRTKSANPAVDATTITITHHQNESQLSGGQVGDETEKSIELAEHRSSLGRIYANKRESLVTEEHFGGAQNSPRALLTPRPKNSVVFNQLLSASDQDVSCASSNMQVDYLAVERARKRKNTQQKQKKVALMFCMIALVFLVGNSGNFVLLTGRLFDALPTTFFQSDNNSMNSLFTVAHHLPYAMNPIIYAIMSPKFRDEFREQTKNCPFYKMQSTAV